LLVDKRSSPAEQQQLAGLQDVPLRTASILTIAAHEISQPA
jgi:hypothetical protein